MHIALRGAVQGVGFRPFVYRLASDMKLPGWVLNSPEGVFIEVEGEKDDLDSFSVSASRRETTSIIHPEPGVLFSRSGAFHQFRDPKQPIERRHYCPGPARYRHLQGMSFGST